MISNCYFLERDWASSIKWMNDARVLLPSVEENLDDELKMLGYLIMAGLGNLTLNLDYLMRRSGLF